MSSDNLVMYTILVIFLILGGALPFVAESYGQATIHNNNESIQQLVGQGEDQNQLTIFTVLLSIFKMFFWTFGDIPFFIDLIILTPLRLMFGYILSKNIRGTAS